jgi:hypothetical protein
MLPAEIRARVRRVSERKEQTAAAVRAWFGPRGGPQPTDQGGQVVRALDLWVAELSFVIENVGLFIYKRRLEEMCGVGDTHAEGRGRPAALAVLRDALARAADPTRPPSEVESRNLARLAGKSLDELCDLTDNVAEVLIGESSRPAFEDGYEPLPDSDTAFVIMSFRPDLQDVYEMAIESAVNKCELRSYRADYEEPIHLIAQEVLDRIARAKLVICDLTYERPNCYYELGFARALRKRAVLTCRDDHDPRRPNRDELAPRVHFDVDSQKITYWKTEDLARFRRELILRIQNTLGR